jgi:hypothetical protein
MYSWTPRVPHVWWLWLQRLWSFCSEITELLIRDYGAFVQRSWSFFWEIYCNYTWTFLYEYYEPRNFNIAYPSITIMTEWKDYSIELLVLAWYIYAGDSFNSSLVAIVVIDPETLPVWAKSRGIKVHKSDKLPMFFLFLFFSPCKFGFIAERLNNWSAYELRKRK